LEYWTYNPLNGKLGIPIRLKGKDEDSFGNFEIQARASDINDAIEPDNSFSEKVTFGISIGLPFNSLIN